MRFLQMLFLFCFLGPGGAFHLAGQVNPDYQLYLESGTVAPGGTVEIALALDNTGGDIQGWSYGVCSDPSLLAVLIVEPGAATAVVNNGSTPDFYSENYYANGWAIGAVVSFIGCCTLDPGLGHELNVATYSAVGPPGTVASVELCQTLGSPPWTLVIVVEGASETPGSTNGQVIISDADFFTRGDVNGDGGFNIADAVRLLGYLFTGAPAPECLDSSDGNDDGNLNLGDAVMVLNSLFVPGSPPLPPPSPGNCGEDPTDDSLDCENYPLCP